MDCEHCMKPIREDGQAVHFHCHEQELDTSHENGVEEGKIEGHEEAWKEHGESAELSEVQALALAVRVGDRAAAEMALDLIAAEINGWADAVAKGRYHRLAKAAA